jgi:hypothetical protein
VYAIKVYLSRPKKSGLATKDGYFMESVLQKNYYLMRDLEDHVVHIYTRKEKAQSMVDYLQELNPKMLIQITEDIPPVALARALKKKADEKTSEANESNSTSG